MPMNFLIVRARRYIQECHRTRVLHQRNRIPLFRVICNQDLESQRIDALRRANVSLEILHLGLDLFETLLDNVADANDPTKCSFLDYRQVSDALERHHIHQINQAILGEASLDLTGHQLIDGKC